MFQLRMRDSFARHTAAVLTLTAFTSACAPVTRQGLEPMVTDRPDFTESTETVPSGMRQVEVGTTFARRLEQQSTSVGETILRVAVLPRAELRIGLNSYTLASTAGEAVRGFEDFSLGTKVKLMNGGGDGSLKPNLSIIVGSTFPSGGAAFKANKPQPEMKFGMAWDLTSRVAFSSNLNAAYVTDNAASYAEFAATGSVGVGLTKRISSYLEFFSFLPQQNGVSASHYTNGGLTYLLTDNLQFDVRSGVGLRRTAGPDYFVGAGVSRRW